MGRSFVLLPNTRGSRNELTGDRVPTEGHGEVREGCGFSTDTRVGGASPGAAAGAGHSSKAALCRTCTAPRVFPLSGPAERLRRRWGKGNRGRPRLRWHDPAPGRRVRSPAGQPSRAGDNQKFPARPAPPRSSSSASLPPVPRPSSATAPSAAVSRHFQPRASAPPPRGG